MISTQEATSTEAYKIALELIKEYVAQLGVDLSFQNIHQEIQNIEQQYARPEGVMIIVYTDNEKAIGCFGIRAFEESICELKRMYLKKEYQGLGIGKELLAKSLELGKALGYKKMRLDTLPSMQAAIGLYKNMGFYEIPAYRFNPIEGTKYFEIVL